MTKRGLVLYSHSSAGNYESRRVFEEATRLGVLVDQCDYARFGVLASVKNLEVFYETRPFNFGKYDWVYPRATNRESQLKLGEVKTNLLWQCIRRGLVVANGSSLIRWPILPKSTQAVLFAEGGLPIPTTLFGQNEGLMQSVGGYPLIVKQTVSSQGKGVYKVESAEAFKQQLFEPYGARECLLYQQYIQTNHDYRVFVIGGKAVGAMKRRAANGRFLTNISQGGVGTKAVLGDHLRRLAEEAAKIVLMEIGGVDIIFSKQDQGLVLEVNRHAQFEGFEEVTGINVARKIAEYLMILAKESNAA